MKSMFKRMTMGNPDVTVHKGAGSGITDDDREIVRKSDDDEARSLAGIKQEMAAKYQKPADKTISQ